MEEHAEVAPSTVKKLLSQHWKGEDACLTTESAALTAELLRIFVVEATARSIACAKTAGKETVETEDLEKVLPQLLLDF